MHASKQTISIFSQKLDRAAFVAYFLGAVVPLVALAFVVERYVLPSLSDVNATAGMVGLVVSIGVLSLSSFLILRRTTRGALKQMDRDNLQLASLLEASNSLAAAQHGNEIATLATASALRLTGARAVFAMVSGEAGRAPVLLEAAGKNANKIFQALEGPLGELAAQVMCEGRPAVVGPSRSAPGSKPGITCAAVVPLTGDAAASGVLVAIHTKVGARFDAARIDGLSTLAGLASVALHNADLQDAQRNFFAHVTEILVQALDTHLDYHAGHAKRVAQYANRLGRELGLDEEQMQRLHFASLLHDIGMLKLDRTLQQTAKACAQHTVLGFRMLGQIRFWRDIAPVVHHHHERFDGSGYPEGLAGEAIPLLARIIGLCEAFDSMTSCTSYKAAKSFEEAVAEIEAGAGTQFDPQVVRAFLGLVERGVIERSA